MFRHVFRLGARRRSPFLLLRVNGDNQGQLHAIVTGAPSNHVGVRKGLFATTP
jgi:hypothetical protein